MKKEGCLAWVSRIAVVLTAIMVVLKLCGYIVASWWIVFLPLVVTAIGWLVVLIFALLYAAATEEEKEG